MLVQNDYDVLAPVATGREGSFFAGDVETLHDEMRAAVADKRVLIIGGAGSIGSSTTEFIADLNPAALHIVDQNENNLAELTRQLRSRSTRLSVEDFRTYPIDYGSPIMSVALDESGPYDLVLNFAALKHVRSEKDVPSLLQMLDTNLVKNRFLMDALAAKNFVGRYFCVSTDKAANPVSLMGASKRIMEHLIFSRICTPGFQGKVTAARFANVAFSDGSLLRSFVNRLSRGQPLVAPRDTRRYFVSPRESGQICAVAALTGMADTIIVPKLNPEEHLVRLEDVAANFLRSNGLEPRLAFDEEDARAFAGDGGRNYPLYLSALDTSGEKPFEEFFGAGEVCLDLGLKAFSAVSYAPAPEGSLACLMEIVDQALARTTEIDKVELVRAIAAVVPEMRHRETGLSLDGRM